MRIGTHGGGGVWCTAQSGMWQTARFEPVCERRIEKLEINAQADTGGLALAVAVRDRIETGNDPKVACTPLCDLCWENEGFAGAPEHPAKPGLRILETTGAFKRDDEGRLGWNAFTEALERPGEGGPRAKR